MPSGSPCNLFLQAQPSRSVREPALLRARLMTSRYDDVTTNQELIQSLSRFSCSSQKRKWLVVMGHTNGLPMEMPVQGLTFQHAPGVERQMHWQSFLLFSFTYFGMQWLAPLLVSRARSFIFRARSFIFRARSFIFRARTTPSFHIFSFSSCRPPRHFQNSAPSTGGLSHDQSSAVDVDWLKATAQSSFCHRRRPSIFKNLISSSLSTSDSFLRRLVTLLASLHAPSVLRSNFSKIMLNYHW
jgi:hypothetical protein